MKEGWKEFNLGEIAPYWTEKIDAPELSEDNYISADNMEINIGGISKSSYPPQKGRATLFEPCDILFSNIRPYFRKMWFATFYGGCSNDVLVFRVNQDFADPKFIFYSLSKQEFVDYVMAGANGVKMPRGNKQSIPLFRIQVPPLPTQRKIAAVLSAYDDLIENNLKRIKLLEEKAQLMYEEWFVRMRFPGHETTPINPETDLPVGWEKVKLGDVCNTSSGGTPSKSKEIEYYEDGTIPWIRTGELKKFILTASEKFITEAGLKGSSAKMFPKNTVILAMYGNTIGETTFVTFPFTTNQACCAFLVDSKTYLSYFLHQFLLKNKSYVLNFRMGAAQENISQTIIKNMKILMPNENILVEFEKVIQPIYALIELLIKQNHHLKESRDILLPRLMTGMIDVDDLDLKMN